MIAPSDLGIEGGTCLMPAGRGHARGRASRKAGQCAGAVYWLPGRQRLNNGSIGSNA